MTPAAERPNDLDWHLSRLIEMLDGLDDKPRWRGVWIVEGFWASEEKQELDRGALLDPEEFAPRFKEIVTSGHTWINLHAVGVLHGRLLISLEAVSPQIIEGCATSVNLSGPLVRRRGWILDELVEIVDAPEPLS